MVVVQISKIRFQSLFDFFHSFLLRGNQTEITDGIHDVGGRFTNHIDREQDGKNLVQIGQKRAKTGENMIADEKRGEIGDGKSKRDDSIDFPAFDFHLD